MRLQYGIELNPPPRGIADLPSDTEVVFAPMESIPVNGGPLDISQRRPLGGVRGGSYSYFEEGDLLLAKVTPCFENGKKALVQKLPTKAGFATSEVHVIRVRNEVIDRRYLNYVFSSHDFRSAAIAAMTGASGLRRVPEEVLLDYRLPITDVNEQRRIADFLDRKTARIDELIGKKERFLELAYNRKDVLVYRLLFAKDDRTRDRVSSNLGWIGSIPKDWTVQSVWMLFRLGRGRVISHEDIIENPGPYPVYSSQTKGDGMMGSINTYDFEGDYLTWTTDGANAGTVFRRSGRFNCTNVCGTLKPMNKVMSLDYFQQSIGFAARSFVRQDINPKLMNDVMARIRIPVPPIAEQHRIATVINEIVKPMTVLEGKMNEAILKLREHRSALISAAVTGQSIGNRE